MTCVKNNIKIYDQISQTSSVFHEEMGLLNDFLSVLYEYSQETAFHCIRVCRLSVAIGRYFKMSEAEIKPLYLASILHDIGKTAIPKGILDKHTSLNDCEYAAVKKHSYVGYIMVKRYSNLKDAAEFILCHHERYDGNGYPNGLHGESIPYISRIISVADAFDAMTSERPYRNSLSAAEAIEELDKEKWKQFDGEIVEVFIDIFNRSWKKDGTLPKWDWR